MAGDYEYRGLIARSWDLLRGDTSTWSDRGFYLDLVRESGEPVLDVGCGTGRLLLDYAQQGIDIDGVDNSPEMLAICNEKAATLGLAPAIYEQAVESLELPRRYRTILVPSSSIQLVIEPDAVREAMRRLHTHLEPGGALAMSFMLMWSGEPQTEEQAQTWHKTQEATRDDGAVVRRWTRARYDSEAQLEHTEDRYEVLVDDVVVETEDHSRSPGARWYTQAESRLLYEDAGFVDVRLFREFTREDAGPDDRIWTAVGYRPV